MLDTSSLTKMMNDEQYLIIKGIKYKHMKNSLIACAILFCSMSFAQDLFVDTGSYVFVDGTAFTSGPGVAPLYVTNDIALATDGNIYLRNEAQLLQGDGTVNSTNDGQGQLSVYQTGNSNTYMYNYWCSPVGVNAGIAGNTDFRPNNVLYGETIAPITSNLATYVSAPDYDGVAASPPVIAEFWFYSFIGVFPPATAYLNWNPINSGGTLSSGYGFTMKGNPSGAQLYDFRGRANNGTITATINANRETLVGNPYPSALDAYYFINDPLNTGIADEFDAIVNPYTTGVLKYWEQAPGSTSHLLSSYVGGYAHYTIATDNNNGTPSDLTDDTVFESFVPATFYMYLLDGQAASGSPIGNGTKVARRYIPVGQGFMVEGNTTGTISFSNSQRAFYKQSGANSSFFRTATAQNNSSSSEAQSETQYNSAGFNIVPPSVKRFRINIGFDNNGNDSYTRQLLMNFHHRATDGFDYGFEAKGGGDLESDAYWILDDDSYVIQAFKYNESLKIPLIVKITNQQLNRFSTCDVQNFEENQPIYLHDKEQDIYINLREQAFEIVLEQGEYTDRFEIVFTSEAALAIDESDINTLTINQNNGLGKLLVLNPKRLDVSSIEVYDVSGKRLLQGVYDAMLNRYELSTAGLSDGVYVVNVISRTSAVKSQKIIVKN